MDALSELLKSVSVRDALFCRAEYSARWSLRVPSSNTMPNEPGPSGAYGVVYYFIVDGSASVRLESGSKDLRAGDIVMVPFGTAHVVGNGADSHSAHTGDGGPFTRMVRGFIAFEPHGATSLLAGLPRICAVNVHEALSLQWLEGAIDAAAQESGTDSPGMQGVRAKVAEALFAETLRCYIASAPRNATGLFGAACDSAVAKALALVHAQPVRPWTIAEIAARAGVSRSVLAQRFRASIGEPPIAYLTRWRLQLGSRSLRTTRNGVAQIAAEVGYESEAAFNRAFKREFGIAPARFRAQANLAGASA